MKDQESRKHQWLTDLAGAREVFAYAPEFGPRYPILKGVANCARFFRPWTATDRCRYLSGRIGLSVPLMELVATGHLATITQLIARAQPLRARGLFWPADILIPLSHTDKKAAKALLRRSFGQLGAGHGVSNWLQAAVYWKYAFEDRARSHQCLANFRTALIDPTFTFLENLTQLRVWINLLDRRQDALPFLFERIKELSGRMKDTPVTGRLWAQLAIVFKDELDDAQWALYCLDRAQVSGYGGGRLAVLWATLFGDHPPSPRLSHQTPANTASDFLAEAFLRKVIEGTRSVALRALRLAEKAAVDVHDLMKLADAWLLLFDDRDQALRLDKNAQRMAELQGIQEQWAATHCALFGKSSGIDLIFVESAVSINDPRRMTQMAEIHLDTLGDEEGCRVMLSLAEGLCASATDLCHCAEEWVHLIGDLTSARRCLRQAAELSADIADDVLCATTEMWIIGSGQARIAALNCRCSHMAAGS